MHELDSIPETSQPFRRETKRGLVTVEPNQPRGARRQQRGAVPAQPGRAVNERPAARRREQRHHFVEHHRFMSGVGHRR